MIINEAIDNGKAFDWGKTSADYGKYRDIYPELFYQKIIDLGLCLQGQSVLDLGTGTGVLPRNMYKYGADFVGIDISENQISEAIRLSRKENMNIDYIVSSAEDINFPENHFDVITACQCFMYFDKNTLLPKIHKILKKNGHFCILFMAWLPDENKIAKNSENLVLKYNPDWTGAHMKRYEPTIPDWSKDLFEVDTEISYDINLTFTRKSWHGRIKACRGIGASSLSEKEISEFENEHISYLNSVPETFDIVHYVSLLNLRKRNI